LSQTAKTIRITKVDTERRLVTAITNVLTDGRGNHVVDHDGDVILAEDLEEVFIKSFSQGGAEMGGTMHRKSGGADVVEHFVFTARDWSALESEFGHDLSTMPELGVVKFRVTDDRLWADIKAGNYPEVSIEGEGTRQDL
jgi:hypothetical protein